MIQLLVNGEAINSDETCLAEFLKNRNKNGASFAVAVNQQFIAKAKYPTIKLKDGDQIELVAPMQGG